jgi:hypothetical protein
VKLGGENRRQVIALIVLLAIAAFTLTRWMGSGSSAPRTTSSTATTTAQTTTKKAKTRERERQGPPAKYQVAALDPALHFEWLKDSEAQLYKGGERNPFREYEPPPPPPEKKGGTEVGDSGPKPPPPPPPPPPINLKFYGFASKAGEKKRIFLTNGDDVFIASEGDVVSRRYKVLHITNTSVEIEDVLNNNKQTIPLSSG